jgi:hypothetical protein
MPLGGIQDLSSALNLKNPPQPTSSNVEGHNKLILSYVPEVVLKRLQVGHNEWIGELRVVTIVFININKEVLRSLELMNQVHKFSLW